MVPNLLHIYSKTNFYSSVVNESRFIKFAKDLSEAFKQDIIISLK